MTQLSVFVVVVCLAACCAFADESGLVSSQFIYDDAPFPSCHASTIVETPTGLVAAWFGGTKEGAPDVGIWLARQVDGQWTAPVEVARDDEHPCWNPVLFQPPGESLMLFYKVGSHPREWWGMLLTSDDGGATWSSPRRLPDGILGPIKNKPVLLADGTLLCPTSKEDSELGWRVFVESTHDLGETWRSVGPLNEGKTLDAIQPSFLLHPNGRLQMLCRTRQKFVATSWSDDAGSTWSPMQLTNLPNPNAGTDAVTLADGRHVLVYNPVPKGRTPLVVAISDDGVMWRTVATLEDEPGSEFSYPAVIQSSDGLIHVTYTWKRQRIRHAVLDPAAWR